MCRQRIGHPSPLVTGAMAIVIAMSIGGALAVSGCKSDSKPQSGTGTPTQPVTTVKMGQRGGNKRGQPVSPDPGSGTAVAPITNNDPCANRLHEICGTMLAYYQQNRRLPDNLDELRQVPGFDLSNDEFTCPVSRLPYIFDPKGIPAPASVGGRIILADATPAHSHLRWAVSIVEPGPSGGALVAKVIAVPESYFTTTQRTGEK